MLNVTKELTALARKLGYTGKAPDTVAKAINAITSVAGEGGGSGDGCDCEPGYEKVETPLFNETVTTADNSHDPAPSRAMLAYSSLITAPALSVTFGNSTYELPLNMVSDGGEDLYIYGEVGESGFSFSTYPFFIISVQNPDNPNEVDNIIYTETAGTYSIAANAITIAISPDFEEAVNECVDINNNLLPMLCVDGITTRVEISNAVGANRLLYFYDRYENCHIIVNYMGNPMDFIPEKIDVSAGYNEDNIFTITYASDE